MSNLSFESIKSFKKNWVKCIIKTNTLLNKFINGNNYLINGKLYLTDGFITTVSL